MQTDDSEAELVKAEFCGCLLKEVGSKKPKFACATSETNSFSSERSFSEQIASSSSMFGRQLASLQPQQASVFKLLSLGELVDQASYFTSLSVVGCAVQYLPTIHSIEEAVHEWAVGLQLAIALRLLIHIRENLSILTTTATSKEITGDFLLPKNVANVIVPLTSKHLDKQLSKTHLVIWLLKTIAEYLVLPPKMSTSMWLELPVKVDASGSDTVCLEPLYYRVLVLLFSLLTRSVDSEAGERAEGIESGVQWAKILLQTILTRLFTAPGSLLRFLAMIWTVPIGEELELSASMSNSCSLDFDAAHISARLQACSLGIAKAYLKSLSCPAVVGLVGPQCPVVSSLLIPIMSSHKTLREEALDCVTIIQEAIQFMSTKQFPIGLSPLILLVEKITESKVELEKDPAYLQQLFGKMLSTEIELDAWRSTTKRKHTQQSTVSLADKEEVLQNEVQVLECVMMHAIAMRSKYVQHMLLSALMYVEHAVKFDKVLPFLIQLLEKCNAVPPHKVSIEISDKSSSPLARKPFPLSPHEYLSLKLCIGIYVPKMAALLTENTEGFQLLIKLIGTNSFDKYIMEVPSPQELAINQVTPAFFNSLGSLDLQQALLQQLVDTLLHTRLLHVCTLIKDRVKKLKLSSELVVTELTRHLDQLGGDITQTPRKRTRRQSKVLATNTCTSNGTPGLPLPWKRLTSVMELIQQTSDTISDPHLLPPHLFNLLNKCLEVEEPLRNQLEYTQQLLLSALLDICSYLTAQGIDRAKDVLDENQFNIELVVQCIRLSSNPQTHHHALLLLSVASSIFPNRVLHNIMPIFTFMGAHLLHQDDQYSFQVIAKTIDTVIPPLITSGSAIFSESSLHTHHQSSKFYHHKGATLTQPVSVEGVVKEIIHVFVDALPHIPDHRRLPLFTHLLATVGIEEYLYVALGLLVAKQVLQASLDQQVTKEADATFPISLALEFPIKNVLLSMLRLIQHLSQLPEEKPLTNYYLRRLPASTSLLFNIAAHTNKQLQQFKLSSLSLLLSLLSQKSLTHRISVTDSKDSTNVEDIVVKLLEIIIGYASHLNQIKTISSSPETKPLLKKTYHVVDMVFSLLSVGSFVTVVTQLLGGVRSESIDLQQRTIEIFNSKLESRKLKLQRDHDEALLGLVERLLEVAKLDSNPNAARHSALHGIQLLTKRIGNRHSSEFFKVAQVICPLCQVVGVSTKVLCTSLQCLSELCRAIGPHMIPLLPTLLPTVLKHLGGAYDKASCRSESLQLSAASCLDVITETLPKFLSSFINDIITMLCHSTIIYGRPNQLLDKLSHVRHNASVLIPSRTLLPAYHKCYPNLLAQGKDSVCALLDMLSSTITELKKEDVKNHIALLSQMFISMLDYRTSEKDMETTEVEAVESQCIEAFSLLVVKLSETSFRPVFLKLLDWATHPSSPKDRLITFYHLTDCVAEKLKNLFLLFAGHLLKNAASLLESNHLDNEGFAFFDSNEESVSVDKSCLLLRYILQTLTKCFLYDKSNFLTKERFDTLLHPLVNQMTNTIGGTDCYRERVEYQLGPCLAHFTVAAGKDSLWKPVNQQLLLKSRHSESQVRFALLKVLQEIYSKLGEEFVVLLPETIPFLAELMEDESEEVEQQAQTLISIIEDIVGESIQQYF